MKHTLSSKHTTKSNNIEANSINTTQARKTSSTYTKQLTHKNTEY
ncbi:hypothetical protein [Helicobacter sp.]